MPEDKAAITDKRGGGGEQKESGGRGGGKRRYLNYVTRLRDDLDDSAVDTNIISHYLGAVCARRFASSHESSHTVLSQRGGDTHTHKLSLSVSFSHTCTHTSKKKKGRKRCGGLGNEGQKGLKERDV